MRLRATHSLASRDKVSGEQGRNSVMINMNRRSIICGSVSATAANVLGRSYIAKAKATTAVIWVGQGFVPEEDEAFRKTIADYEKASGNKIDASIMPFQALNQKTISALTSGTVPDLVFHGAPETILPQNAWNDRLVDLTDIVEAHKSQLSETAVLCSTFYNSVTKS